MAGFGHIRTVDGVLDSLDGVIAEAVEQRSRLGFFAVIYRKVTAKVAEGIANGFFDDAERMHRFDVTFARRYLDAVAAYQSGDHPTRSWETAFRAATKGRPIILQQLLVGINAHINLDLGIAAATTAPGQDLPSLRGDFDRINEILASLIAGIEHDLAEVSPWIGLLDWIGGRHDEEVIRFSVEVARAEAWRFAVELAPLARDDWPGPVRARDARVAHLARRILNPGRLNAGLLVIRARERNDVREIIHLLNRVEPPDLDVVESHVRQERAATP